MSTQRHKFFRWTPRTAGITFAYAIAVPFIIGVIAYQTDVRIIPPTNPRLSNQMSSELVLSCSNASLQALLNRFRIDMYLASYRESTNSERRGKET